MATIRQEEAFDKVVENGGNVSKGMIEANYSPATAKTPQKLTESKGWQELIDKHISESKLAKVHSEGLKAVIHKGKKKIPDYSTRHKYLETGYKIRGKMKESNQNITLIQGVQINVRKDD